MKIPDGHAAPPREPDEEGLTLSALLLTLADRPAARLSIEEIVAHFGRRAFGAVLFFFALPNLLPLPPGSSTVLGLPLLLIAPQLALGGNEPWLPRALARRTVDAPTIDAACRRLAPWVRKAERLTTRRLDFMFGRAGDVVIGVVCTLLAAVLILPIPLGNLLPALAVVLLAMSLTQRDGVLTLMGYTVAAVSAGVLVLSGHLVAHAVARLGRMIGWW
jgi:hypothetical protein